MSRERSWQAFSTSSMDLRTSFPRSMRFKLEGYVHLARMIDKCRAVLAGTEGEYIYPCPMDFRLMEFAGITHEQFTAAVETNPTDEGVAKWFRGAAKPHQQAELDEWNETMLRRGPSTPEKQAYFNKCRDAVDPSRTDLTAWSDLQDLEEGRPVPRRSP
ncbi:DUF5069 domain-containing protein [Nitrospira sp. NS4]|uniref:DUF5069 domain-containing protein n=1 Tax=Nitrospira sp. NS4 TaxID=3414498 RepID=UPI003C2B4DA7